MGQPVSALLPHVPALCVALVHTDAPSPFAERREGGRRLLASAPALSPQPLLAPASSCTGPCNYPRALDPLVLGLGQPGSCPHPPSPRAPLPGSLRQQQGRRLAERKDFLIGRLESSHKGIHLLSSHSF